jgi:uncharacterized protein
MYANGFGVKKDYAKARYYYELAAISGEDSAQNNLGEFYNEGLGVAKDQAKAITYFNQSAAQGYATAFKNLAAVYAAHDGEANAIAAYAWLILALEGGEKDEAGLAMKLKLLLSTENTALAKARAEKCKASEYLECGYEFTPSDTKSPSSPYAPPS